MPKDFPPEEGKRSRCDFPKGTAIYDDFGPRWVGIVLRRPGIPLEF